MWGTRFQNESGQGRAWREYNWHGMGESSEGKWQRRSKGGVNPSPTSTVDIMVFFPLRIDSWLASARAIL
jgi:hypothetical protein